MGKVTVSGAAAGASGALWRRVLSVTGKGAGNYVLNESNYPGLGAYLPCNALIVMTGGAGVTNTLQVTTDGGTTWLPLAASAAASSAGFYVPIDTANTLRIVIAGGNGDVRFYIE